VEFPEVTAFWEGEKMRSMGAGVRAKNFAFVPVKVTKKHDTFTAKFTCINTPTVSQSVKSREMFKE